MITAYLVLQNGQTFEGTRFGAAGEVEAELVFATGMIGYLETLTDPACHGEMVVMTFPMIGNYGVISRDFESARPHASAFIVREVCDNPSNFRCEGSLDTYLRDSGVVGLCGVDTRALTRILREQGSMNAAIIDRLPDDLAAFARSLAGKSLGSTAHQVTCEAPYALGEGTRHVALWDLGAKHALIEALIARGCRVTVMPAASCAEDMLALQPDGILLSGGPGDPAAHEGIISQIARVMQAGIPMMGIALGHLLLAHSQGAASEKMKYGHRGGNQPVRRTEDGRLFITAQGHGYAVKADALPANARASYENVNDLTNEGLEYLDRPAFSVQFQPEARSGPEDTAFLFDKFMKMMEG